VTLNVSCPNAFGGETFTNPARLEHLLTAVDGLHVTKPIFIKLGADLSSGDVDAIVDVADRHRVDGFIFSNLTKDYHRPDIDQSEISTDMKGGISGKPVAALSNALIAHVYARTRKKYVLVGCGGIFSAEDAYEKIRSGASLVQLITGMIFEGPQLIGEINRGLVDLLKKDGFSTISEAVGAKILLK
jgi:dihydroorotate dehydrogenase